MGGYGGDNRKITSAVGSILLLATYSGLRKRMKERKKKWSFKVKAVINKASVVPLKLKFRLEK